MPDLSRLLRMAPTLHLIASSRAPLEITGERIFELDPMDPGESEALFLERARAAGVDALPSDDVRSLCRRLDGLPLALELAAARVGAFSPSQLLELLGDRARLLRRARGADPRHSTLVDVVMWSYELLDDDERRLFASLSVFSGGCTWDAAVAVCQPEPEQLAALVDASLVRRSAVGSVPRYWMLETIRAVAADQLETMGLADERRHRHAEWAVRAMPLGPEGRSVVGSWAAEEVDNLRAAIDFSIKAQDQATAVELLTKTWQYWLFGGHAEEGDRTCQRLLESESLLSREELSGLLAITGEFARYRGDRERSLGIERRSIDLARELGNQRRLAGNLHDLAENLAAIGRFDEAREAGHEALVIRKRLGYPPGIVHAIQGLASVAAAEGDRQRALELDLEAVEMASRDGEVEQGYLHGLLSNLASDHQQLGDRDAALAIAAEVLVAIDVRDEADALSSFLEVVARLAADPRPDLAAQLLGAFDAVRAWSGLYDEDVERSSFERELRSMMGEEAFVSVHDRSASCSPEEALELAQEAVRALVIGRDP